MAISPEARATLDEYGKKNGITYPVGIDPSGSVSRSYPGRGIPRSFLVGADGTVVWEGHPLNLTSAIVEEQLQKVWLFKLRDVVPALAEAKKAYEALAFGKAHKSAKAALDKKEVSEEVAADARYIVEEVEKTANDTLALVDKLVAQHQYAMAVAKLEEMAKRFEGMDFQKTALDKKQELEADKEIKRELDAAKYLKAIREKIAAAKRNKEKKSFIVTLQGFMARHKDTEAAKQAAAEIERLRALKD